MGNRVPDWRKGRARGSENDIEIPAFLNIASVHDRFRPEVCILDTLDGLKPHQRADVEEGC